MRFLFLESFYGGSHKDVADGIVAHSRHHVDLITLPSRFWKWRMRGAALHFIRKIPPLKDYQGLLVTDLMSLADFKAMAGPDCPPAAVYFHESQFTYPLSPGEHRDYQFGFTDITTALAAERVFFNSHTHCESFFEHLPRFIQMMPEYRPGWVVDAIRRKSGVLYPGCHFNPAGEPLQAPQPAAPLIIWNHRWEFDKNPSAFFEALDALAGRGLSFHLALLGENYQKAPKEFIQARKRWKDRILQYGYVSSRDAYHRWLRRGAVVVSTAFQENFGISVIEAMRYGCLPLLPHRLVYPEILPREFHSQFLYRGQKDLENKLARLLAIENDCQKQRESISRAMKRFAWKSRIDQFDEALEQLARTRGKRHC